ncbi:MAG: O-antigen ligase family protein [Sedimentisphaerales bacterium]|nr:O-antigen ligase family protein [Sedimentisphaerales bacterium]
MKLRSFFKIFSERMAEVDLLPVLLILFIVLVILILALRKWGAGLLLTCAFVLVGLQLTRSNVLNGLVLVGRFMLIFVLTMYAFFSYRNKRPFSPILAALAILPVAMILNSIRAYNFADAALQSMLFMFMYIGLILGGRKILGDSRGRAIFTRGLMLFSIIMICIQLPYLSEAEGLFQGVFENVVGIMIIGVTGAIILFWFAMKHKFASPRFIFYISFFMLSFVLVLLSGGRGAIAGTLLGILVIMARRLRRNVVIFLAALIILAPIGLKTVSSFAGIETVKRKLFSTQSSGRTYLWKLAWGEIQQNPIIGGGTGSSTVKGMTTAGKAYHNSYLEFAVEHGIPVAFMLLCAYVWLPLRGLYLMRKCQTEEMKDMANLSAAFLAAYIFSSFLGGVLIITTGILTTYTAFALQEGVWAEQKELENYLLYEYENDLDWAEDAQHIPTYG